jgi:hypothetical protein
VNDHGVQRHRTESRWPAAVATLIAVALYAALPNRFLVGPRYVIPGLELLMLAAVIAVNPLRMNRQTTRSRALTLALTAVILVTNLFALVALLRALVAPKGDNGPALLVAALQVWLTNVIVFALAYWEMDRSGPVIRRLEPRDRLPLADFRFPQDENRDTVIEVSRGASSVSGWLPAFVDYLYVSLTNSSAFSPTDTMPLSTRAKIMMGFQSSMALITSVVVIARGVGSLG